MSNAERQNQKIDPDGLDEFSVVFTERSLNHMSQRFRGAMREISAMLKATYAAHRVAVVPGGGTFGMESVARLFATGKRCLVIRNGWFSYRWSQIFEAGSIPADCCVLSAERCGSSVTAPFAPASLDSIREALQKLGPAIVFAPHVETSSGMLLPDAYLAELGQLVHESGGVFVLDCVASGALWVDMKLFGIDVLITAPQKGWSSTPCASLVLLSEKAASRAAELRSTSFACDLNAWLTIMQKYEEGHHAYHATMPTDSLIQFRDSMKETIEMGLEEARQRQLELGGAVRDMLAEYGYPSVAEDGYQSPSVVVSYTDDAEIKSGSKFASAGVQVAGGVPLMCGEGDAFSTFRIGLFGLDKWRNIQGTCSRLKEALDCIVK